MAEGTIEWKVVKICVPTCPIFEGPVTYFKIFSRSLSTMFTSAGMATSISIAERSKLSWMTMSGRWAEMTISVLISTSHSIFTLPDVIIIIIIIIIDAYNAICR